MDLGKTPLATSILRIQGSFRDPNQMCDVTSLVSYWAQWQYV